MIPSESDSPNDSAPPSVTVVADDAALQPEHRNVRRVIGRPFAKGVSGNPSGRRLGSVSLKSACKRLISERDCKLVVAQLLDSARSGNLPAIKLLAELLDDLGPLVGVQVSVANTIAAEERIRSKLPIDYEAMHQLQRELIEGRAIELAREMTKDSLNGELPPPSAA